MFNAEPCKTYKCPGNKYNIKVKNDVIELYCIDCKKLYHKLKLHKNNTINEVCNNCNNDSYYFKVDDDGCVLLCSNCEQPNYPYEVNEEGKSLSETEIKFKDIYQRISKLERDLYHLKNNQEAFEEECYYRYKRID